MIAANNEEKRSKLWNIVMSVSTIVIIMIVVFFVVKIFTANPLEGAWVRDGDSLTIAVKPGDKAEIQWPEQLADQDIKVNMLYDIDKETKTFKLHMTADGIAAASEAMEGAMTEEELESALSTLESTFDYSIDGQQLTLTDREYGDQMFFEKN